MRGNHLSLTSLKIELDGRTSRELWPTYFSMDMLILFCRELARYRDGFNSYAEFVFMQGLLKSYWLHTTEMQGKTWSDLFKANVDTLMPLLVSELDKVIREEILSKLLDVDIRTDNLQKRLMTVIETETEMSNTS